MKIKTENHGCNAYEGIVWTAIEEDTYDGAPDSGCPTGWGHTELEAINDLAEQIVDEIEERLSSARFELHCLRSENKTMKEENGKLRKELDRMYRPHAYPQTSPQDARQGASGEVAGKVTLPESPKVTTGLLDGFGPLDWFEGPAESRFQGRLSDEPPEWDSGYDEDNNRE